MPEQRGILMSKRYTREEDEFIVSYFDAIGTYIGPHDLGRSEASITRRVKFLRKSGIWDAIRDAWAYNAYVDMLSKRVSYTEILMYNEDTALKMGDLGLIEPMIKCLLCGVTTAAAQAACGAKGCGVE